jgi:tetratricopeptide (TPR) repeat protein
MYEMRSSFRRNRKISLRSDSFGYGLLPVIGALTITALITLFVTLPSWGETGRVAPTGVSRSDAVSSSPPGNETGTSAAEQDLLDKMRLLCAKGELLRADGEYKRAEKQFKQALDLAKDLRDRKDEASALVGLAHVYRDAGQYDRAMLRYEKALRIYEERDHVRKQTEIMNHLGLMHKILGENREALALHKKALELARTSGDRKGEARSLGGQGSVYLDMADFEKAEQCYKQALEINREPGGEMARGYALDRLGTVYRHWGRLDKAREYFETSLAIRKRIKHTKGEAESLNHLGELSLTRGRLEEALDYSRQSLEIARKIKAVKDEASALNSLGLVNRSLGEFGRALECHQGSREIMRQAGYVKGEADALNGLGRVYSSLGQTDKALDAYEQAIKLSKRIGYVTGEADALGSMGMIHKSLGRADRALKCLTESLRIYHTIGVPKEEANTLWRMGILYWATDRHDEARKHYQDALAIQERLGLVRDARRTNALLAQLYMDMGDYDRAKVCLEKSNSRIGKARLALLKSDFKTAETAYRKLLAEAEKKQHWENRFAACTGLGMALENLGDYAAAAEYYQRAIWFTEEQRKSLSSEQRATYFDVRSRGFSRTDPYEGLARVRLKLNKPQDAFSITDFSKARAFAEAISMRPSRMHADVPQDVLDKDNELATRRNVLESRRQKAVRYEDKELIEDIDLKIRKLDREIQNHRNEVRDKYPLFAATKYPVESVGLEASALRDTEWVIAYDVTNSAVLIYLVRGNTMVQALMKPIEKTAVQSLVRKFRTPLLVEPPYEPGEVMHKLHSFDFAAGRQLSDLLLSDVLDRIPAGEPIIIIPDDTLGDLPFEALVVKGKGRIVQTGELPVTDGVQFFGDRNPVVYYQSLSALTLARTCGRGEVPKDGLLVIADPVTSVNDLRAPKLPAHGVALTESKTMGPASQRYMGQIGPDIPRLPETGELARRLAAVHEETEAFTGFSASKKLLLEQLAPRLGQFRHIVFALHGSYGDDVAGVTEPVLFLSLLPAGTDGVLRMSEVMGLRINADVVALTACKSGLGRKVSGEGIMGMGRAFQYAGARSVLMSLWSVETKSSTMLTERFCEYLFAGKNKLQALKLARNDIRKAGYDHPLFWAAFILVGEKD